MEIAAIQNMIQTSSPHLFVIGETKNSDPVSSHLDLNDYDLSESPGRPLNARGKGKWGVIVGIRRGLFNVQPVVLSNKLNGRVVALDLTIPTDRNRGFRHRLIGIYAPWNPGGEPSRMRVPSGQRSPASATYPTTPGRCMGISMPPFSSTFLSPRSSDQNNSEQLRTTQNNSEQLRTTQNLIRNTQNCSESDQNNSYFKNLYYLLNCLY